MKPFRNRTINPHKPVRVYRNLHRDAFSLQQDGRVVAHTDKLCLKDVVAQVSQAGRQRVIREKKRNVHAYLIGHICEATKPKGVSELTYNPYLFGSFYVPKRGNRFVTTASRVWLDYPKCFVKIGE
jgi:hypothetical protein